MAPVNPGCGSPVENSAGQCPPAQASESQAPTPKDAGPNCTTNSVTLEQRDTPPEVAGVWPGRRGEAAKPSP